MVPAEERQERLVPLVYELLDAHDDTARLLRDQPLDVRWAAHLDYLSALQRVARETLAAVTSASEVPHGPR